MPANGPKPRLVAHIHRASQPQRAPCPIPASPPDEGLLPSRYPPIPPYATVLGIRESVCWITAGDFIAAATPQGHWRVMHTVAYVVDEVWRQHEPVAQHPLYQWLQHQLTS